MRITIESVTTGHLTVSITCQDVVQGECETTFHTSFASAPELTSWLGKWLDAYLVPVTESEMTAKKVKALLEDPAAMKPRKAK